MNRAAPRRARRARSYFKVAIKGENSKALFNELQAHSHRFNKHLSVMVDMAMKGYMKAATRFATIEAATREQMLLKSEMDRLRSDISTLRAELQNAKEKNRTDLRYEVDKLAGQQRLDLNLEKGRVREELQKQSDQLTKADARLDKEINQVRTQIEASKNDLLRYSVGTIVSFAAVSLAGLRMFM